MRVRVGLSVPLDPAGVPFVRHVLGGALTSLRVEERATQDLAVAVSEACTNVVDHAPSDLYEVTVTVDEQSCVVEVADGGTAAGAAAPYDTGTGSFRPDAPEDGRGISLMRALVDDVSFRTGPTGGLVVRLTKQLAHRGPDAQGGLSRYPRDAREGRLLRGDDA